MKLLLMSLIIGCTQVHAHGVLELSPQERTNRDFFDDLEHWQKCFPIFEDPGLKPHEVDSKLAECINQIRPFLKVTRAAPSGHLVRAARRLFALQKQGYVRASAELSALVRTPENLSDRLMKMYRLDRNQARVVATEFTALLPTTAVHVNEGVAPETAS